MRKRLFTLNVILALTVVAHGATLEEKVDKSYDVRPGTSLDLSNVNGKVVVRAWDTPRVRVQAVKKVDGGDDGEARKRMAGLKVNIQQTATALVIETSEPRRGHHDHGFLDWLFGNDINASVSYELTVPRSMNLNIETVNGSVNVADLQGELDLETTNGRIEVARCSGPVDASTTNGAIKADLLAVTPGKSMRLETTNGGITLSVPATFAAEIDADTTNGSIKSQLPITTQHVSRTSLRGRLNKGGAEVKLRTTNGSISIEQRSAAAPQASR